MTFHLSTWRHAILRKAATGAPTRPGANRPRPPRFMPQLETLEDRMVPAGGYVQTNLVSDIPGLAQITDRSLKNPWGIAESATGPFWVADQVTSVATVYKVTAAGVSKLPLTVAIPSRATPPHGPTGQVFNDTSSFLVNGNPALFIFANLDGTISAWNSTLGTTAQVKAGTTTSGAVYTGLDLESTASGKFLYAANHSQGRIDVFNGSFDNVTPAGSFVDPQLPSGLSPFNVEGINGDIYVAYAPFARADSIAAPEGVGAVAVFDQSGNFIKQLISGGKLAAPWGITLAPARFGEFGGALLVGNFSFVAPEINAFDPVTGEYLGTIADENDNTLLSNGQGIWDMSFGNGGNGGLPNTLYVATGLNDENDGLFAAIDPTPEDGNAQGSNDSGAILAVRDSTFTGNDPAGNLPSTDGFIGNGTLGSIAAALTASVGQPAILATPPAPLSNSESLPPLVLASEPSAAPALLDSPAVAAAAASDALFADLGNGLWHQGLEMT